MANREIRHPHRRKAFYREESREKVVVEREERDFLPPLSPIGGGVSWYLLLLEHRVDRLCVQSLCTFDASLCELPATSFVLDVLRRGHL